MARIPPSFARRWFGAVSVAVVLAAVLGASSLALGQAVIGAPITVQDDPDEAVKPAKPVPAIGKKDERPQAQKRGRASELEAETKGSPPPVDEAAEVAAENPTAVREGSSLSAIILPSDSEATIAQHWKRREENLSNFDAKRVEEEEKTKGGIIIPDSAKEKPVEGEVVAVGSGKSLEDGSVRKLEVKVGDRVLFGKYSGTEVKLDGEEHLIVREDDILGILEK